MILQYLNQIVYLENKMFGNRKRIVNDASSVTNWTTNKNVKWPKFEPFFYCFELWSFNKKNLIIWRIHINRIFLVWPAFYIHHVIDRQRIPLKKSQGYQCFYFILDFMISLFVIFELLWKNIVRNIRFWIILWNMEYSTIYCIGYFLSAETKQTNDLQKHDDIGAQNKI